MVLWPTPSHYIELKSKSKMPILRRYASMNSIFYPRIWTRTRCSMRRNSYQTFTEMFLQRRDTIPWCNFLGVSPYIRACGGACLFIVWLLSPSEEVYAEL